MVDSRLVFVALVAFFCAPLLRPCVVPGSLDDIALWAMKGPSRNITPPIIGVYVLRGVNPALLIDFSYAHSWRAAERSFVIDLGRATLFDTGANASQFSGEFALTSPVPNLRGKVVSLITRALHASLKFTFNAEFTEASIEPALLTRYNPLNLLFNRFIKQSLVQAKGGSWKRVNFVPPTNKTASDAYYFLHPVLTRKPDGTLKVNNDGLKMAKRKLAMGSGSFQQCAK